MSEQYSKEFKEALKTNKVVLRKIWVNQNSSKNQVSAQFIQRVKIPTQGTPNALIGFAQGGSTIEDPGYNLVTTIFSFKKEVADKLGLSSGEYFEQGSPIKYANDIFSTPVSIKVTENITKNPLAISQEPKLNPTSGEVLEYDGKPIYRHTELVEGESVNHTFLVADNQRTNSERSSITTMAAANQDVDA